MQGEEMFSVWMIFVVIVGDEVNPFQISTVWIIICRYSVVDHMKSSTFAFYLDKGPPSHQSENSSDTESESAQLDNLWVGWFFVLHLFAFALLPRSRNQRLLAPPPYFRWSVWSPWMVTLGAANVSYAPPGKQLRWLLSQLRRSNYITWRSGACIYCILKSCGQRRKG